MAHNLATIDGERAMFCVGGREAAWHHLGQRTENAATWAEAMKLAHLDWPVTLQDIMTFNREQGMVAIETHDGKDKRVERRPSARARCGIRYRGCTQDSGFECALGSHCRQSCGIRHNLPGCAEYW